MLLSELNFEPRGARINGEYPAYRAKVLLGDGHRLYLYRYHHAPSRLEIYLNNGAKQGIWVERWQGCDELTAQCVLHSCLEKYGRRRLAWWQHLWGFVCRRLDRLFGMEGLRDAR
jgi:hypothetical protein